MLEDIIFLPLITVIGVLSSWTDIKRGKIKNKLIIHGLCFGFIGYILLFASNMITQQQALSILSIITNVSFSCAIAFLIWYLNLWAAADAKIFILFSFIIPLKYYSQHQLIPIFPSFTLLINIFTIAVAYLSIDALYRLIIMLARQVQKHDKGQGILKKTRGSVIGLINRIKIKKMHILRIIWGYLVMFSIMIVLRDKVRAMLFYEYSVNPIFISIILILLFRPLSSLFRRNNLILIIMSIFLVIYFYVEMSQSIPACILLIKRILYGFRFFAIMFSWFSIYRYLMYKKETLIIDVDGLREHMIPDTETIQKINKVSSLRLYADGLTKPQTEEVKEIYNAEYPSDKLGIFKTFPFAPFIFAGVLATLIKGSPLFVLNIEALHGGRFF